MNTATQGGTVRIHAAPSPHWVGDGFPVQSVFSYSDHGRELNPFLLLDYARPHRFEPAQRPRGVGEHPHRGFETVSIVYQGEVAHRDSTGQGGVIGAGDVQWMTAGAGILHEEFHGQTLTRAGGVLQVAQLWVNLPARAKLKPPRYQAIVAADIPRVDLPGGGGTARVIAGTLLGAKGPAETATPMTVANLSMPAGARLSLAKPEGWCGALVVLEGELRVDGAAAAETQLAILQRAGGGCELVAARDSLVLVLMAEPLAEPIVGYGPFVMNTRAEIMQAIEDFNGGKFGALPRQERPAGPRTDAS
jgi:quercetin 2,3-dioxygenase